MKAERPKIFHIGGRDFTRFPAADGVDCEYVAIDADSDARLDATKVDAGNAHVGTAVGGEGAATLAITRDDKWSSLLKPAPIFDRLQGYGRSAGEPQEVLKEKEITLKPLSACVDAGTTPQGGCILIVNAQGYSYEIVRSGLTTLAEFFPLVILEVEFVELYEGQHLFGDVFNEMNKLGYELLDVNLLRGLYKDPANGNGPVTDRQRVGKGVLLYADAVFFSPAILACSPSVAIRKAMLTILARMGFVNFALRVAGADPQSKDLAAWVTREIEADRSLVGRLLTCGWLRRVARKLSDFFAERYLSAFFALHPEYGHQKELNRIDRRFRF